MTMDVAGKNRWFLVSCSRWSLVVLGGPQWFLVFENDLSVEAVGKASPAGVRLANVCSVQLLLQFQL